MAAGPLIASYGKYVLARGAESYVGNNSTDPTNHVKFAASI